MNQTKAADMIAQQIGSRARALLSAPGYTGSVLVVVSKAVYLLGQDGEILWIALGDSPLHRRAVVVRTLPRLEPGMAFTAQTGRLVFNNTISIDLSQATLWKPRCIRLKQYAGPQPTGSSWWVLSRVPDSPGCRGFARVLREDMQRHLDGLSSAGHSYDTAILRRAAAPLRAVIAGCSASSISHVAQAGLSWSAWGQA